MPAKLSEFPGLSINFFETSDNVKLAWWEAGKGEPLIFIPGWSANVAQYFHIIYLLSKKYHVYVLDLRNQGLSQKVDYGNRISRYAQDVNEFRKHLNIQSAYFSGYSMGAAVLWSYIDNFGTDTIKKISFVDEAPSIYSHHNWSEKERRDAGAFASSAEGMIDIFTGKAPQDRKIVNSDIYDHVMRMDTHYYENSAKF